MAGCEEKEKAPRTIGALRLRYSTFSDAEVKLIRDKFDENTSAAVPIVEIVWKQKFCLD